MIGAGGHAKQVSAEHPFANVVAIGDNRARKRVVLEQEALGTKTWGRGLANLTWNNQHLFSHIDSGTVILKGAVLGADCKIGAHCIINHNAVVDHDATLHDFVHVAPGACVLGGAVVEEGALIGANAVVLPNARVPAWAIVRACTVYPNDYLDDSGDTREGRNGRQLRLKFQA